MSEDVLKRYFSPVKGLAERVGWLLYGEMVFVVNVEHVLVW